MSVVPATMVVVPRQVSPLVGRDAELAELIRFAGSAASGNPGAVLVAGDAGVGKSRLIGELADAAAASGMLVLTGHCVNLPDGGPPYLPFVDALRHVDEGARARLDAQFRGGAVGDSMGALQIYVGVVQLLSRLAQAQPVLLIIEDLHWADRPSQDLLRYLLGRLEGIRVGIVVSLRSDDLHRRHPLRGFLAELARHPMVDRITLDPLAPDAMKDLIRSADCGAQLDEKALQDIVSRADGNAFFAEELLEAARSTGSGRGLPDALLDVLTSRLEQLDADAAVVVGVAAVAGRRVPHEILAEVSGLPQDALDAALREAVGGHVLVGDPEQPAYQFRHALMQEAAYADLLPGERVRLHAAYARALQARLEQRPALAAELAHHAEASHDLPLALAASVRAADHALSVYAPGQARTHLERALQWWDRVTDAATLAGASEAELYLRAAEAARSAGEPARAVGLLEAAVDRLTREGAPADAVAVGLARLSSARFVVGPGDAALETSTSAIGLIADLPRSVATAEVRAQHALILFSMEKPGAEEHAQIALADAVALDAPAIEAGALVTLSRIADLAGDADTAHTYRTRALHLAEKINDVGAELRALFNLAMSRYDAGDLPGTLRWTSRSNERAAATMTSFSEYAKETAGIDVIARYVSGDWDAGLRRAAVRVDRSPAADRPLLEAFALHVAVGRGLDDIDDRLARLEAFRHPDLWSDAQVVMLAEGCRIDHLTWQHAYAGAAAAHARAVEHVAKEWGPHFLGRIWLDALGLAALAGTASAARLRGDETVVDRAVVEGAGADRRRPRRRGAGAATGRAAGRGGDRVAGPGERGMGPGARRGRRRGSGGLAGRAGRLRLRLHLRGRPMPVATRRGHARSGRRRRRGRGRGAAPRGPPGSGRAGRGAAA
jgi:tetratricopeptide (TPR) repeat protein